MGPTAMRRALALATNGLSAILIAATPDGPPTSPSVTPAPSTSADAAARARAAFMRGVDHFEKGEYPKALDAFLEARSLHGTPAIVFNIARTLDKLGRLREAQAAFAQTASEAQAAGNATLEKRANEAEKDVAARIPTLLVTSKKAMTVKVDGTPVTLGKAYALDPGSHGVVATSAGKSKTFSVVLAEKDARTLDVTF